ncbi:DUF4097 family beta strand repeat-containing protein [Streptomyces microflavus]|uniref:DUF4097 family beta strand repeat-containing protein n=1 Tax=Streptomyces microflavus TaxID=1919 RepID=UPI0036598643
MTTSRTFISTGTGAVRAEIVSPVGTVTVTTDPTITNAVITVSTPDDNGPYATAVEHATHYERPTQGMEGIRVEVPEPHGTETPQGHSADNVTVDVRLPGNGSSIFLTSDSADLTVHGDLQTLSLFSHSGGVRAEGVHTLRAVTSTGDIEAQRVDHQVDIATNSGTVTIGAYSGSEFRAHTATGKVRVSATPAAAGGMEIRTRSGEVTTRGTDDLDERIITGSGAHYRH